MVYRVYESFEVSAAHRLENYEGKCHNLHGHNYIVEVWVEAKGFNKDGMVIDFTELKEIVMGLDHKYLNEVLLVKNPTAEIIADWIRERILMHVEKKKRKKYKVKVRVWEDKDSYAEVE